MSALIRYDAVSDVGCRRSNNEDMAYAAGKLLRDAAAGGEVCTSGAAFAVADGMGGYEGGEVASEIVCRSFAAFMKTLGAGKSEPEIISMLKDWAREANTLVRNTAAVRPELSEMGTTFIALLFEAGRLFLLNAGDSRCYRLRSGVLKQLSRDHSERERTGNLEIPSNLIYNFMGIEEYNFISDVSVFSPLHGDRYILCSDGLSDMVSDEEIEVAAGDIESLLEKAKNAGGLDNITIISIRL